MARKLVSHFPLRTQNELAWTAGIIEGEGCIRLAVSRVRDWRSKRWIPTPRVGMAIIVGMKDGAIIQRLHSWYGGYYQKRADGAHIWTLSSNPAMRLLNLIIPYMVGDKLPQAQLAVEFQAQRRPSSHRPPERTAYELDAARRISEMKRIGRYDHGTKFGI